jgi:hypothetical protein
MLPAVTRWLGPTTTSLIALIATAIQFHQFNAVPANLH